MIYISRDQYWSVLKFSYDDVSGIIGRNRIIDTACNIGLMFEGILLEHYFIDCMD